MRLVRNIAEDNPRGDLGTPRWQASAMLALQVSRLALFRGRESERGWTGS